jgi:hypothetical protein
MGLVTLPPIIPPTPAPVPTTPPNGQSIPPNPTTPPAPPADPTVPTPTVPGPTIPVGYSNMQVLYYKINLKSTKTNMYGEALEKWYYPPSAVPCLIERSPITNSDSEFGVDLSQAITVKIPITTLTTYNFLPEIGDIVSDRERFYEITNADSDYINIGGTSNNTSTLSSPSNGYYILYVLTGYLTRTTKLNIIEYYQ